MENRLFSRVATADKATATDSPAHIPKKGSSEDRSSSVATMTSNSNSPKLNEALSAEVSEDF